MKKLCKCGCGQAVTKPTNTFISGHNGLGQPGYWTGRKMSAEHRQKIGNGCRIPIPEKILRNSSQDESGCILWSGWKNELGHGRMSHGRGNRFYVYRWVYEKFFGPIPKGMILHHGCRSPSCIDPFHLIPMTRKQHILFHK